MIKICFLVLTLTTGQSAIINANDITAVTRVSTFNYEDTVIYYSSNAFSSSSVKETVEEIAEKLKECNPSRGGDSFIYVK